MNKLGRNIILLAAASALVAGCQQDGANQAADNVAGGTLTVSDIPETSIGDTLAGSADHSTLLAAVKAAGLEATLSGSQPYTVFAPANAAFDKLPDGTADGLMQPDQKGQLTALLTHHIVPGVVTVRDLAAAIERGEGSTELATVGGGTLTVTRAGDDYVVSDGSGQARVTQADMLQSNGIVHSIDGVLMPGAPAPAEGPTQ